MSNVWTGLIFGIGISGWVYAQMMRRTGGNTKNSVILAAAAGLVGWLVVTTLLSIVFHDK